MVQAIGNTRVNYYKKSMLKRNRKSQKQGSISQTSRTNGKVLTKVSAFFDTLKLLTIKEIAPMQYSKIKGTNSTQTVACFKMKNEHENLHRNTVNNYPLNPAADQQLKRVVAFCLVWW